MKLDARPNADQTVTVRWPDGRELRLPAWELADLLRDKANRLRLLEACVKAVDPNKPIPFGQAEGGGI